MLAAGAAEAVERVAGDVVAALHGDLLDRLRHVGDGDLQKPVGDLLRRAAVADLAGKPCEGGAHRLARRAAGPAAGPKIAGKNSGISLPAMTLASVTVERPAAAIAGRPGIGAGRIRADAQARAVVMQDRAAAGRDRVDQHHRRAHAHAGDLGLEGALVFAVEMRDVGRGAAHVEADDARETGRARRSRPCRRRRRPGRTGSRPCPGTARRR